MDKNIELIAHAILAALQASGEYVYVRGGQLDDVVIDGDFDLMEIARAVMKAMQEPG